MKMMSVILLALLASGAALGQGQVILNCDTADLKAQPYTHFQIVKSGRKAQMRYMVFPFLGAEILPVVQEEEGLSFGNSDEGSPVAETKTSAGGFYFGWGGDGDAAHMEIKRPKTIKKINGKKVVIKSKNYNGDIYFPNGDGPSHLNDGGAVEVSCTLGNSIWKK
ncbi:MAG: hypothetical protein K2X47_17590 [Bdellovibrionales bacterium]|nr:hypothetical protein [Bdellovibrionales bacterium]